MQTVGCHKDVGRVWKTIVVVEISDNRRGYFVKGV